MPKEIERKFLVHGDSWRHGSSFETCCQGYLASNNNCTVRIGILGDKGQLTVKENTESISSLDYEYEIPFGDAEELLTRLCIHPIIMKRRFSVLNHGQNWIIDEFLQDNEGLIIAEIRLKFENEHINLPPWVGEEVSNDRRYSSVNLVRRPYYTWKM
jgi:CYTH domain-containing protein